MDQGDREHPERAVLARQLNTARREVSPGVVCEQLRRNASCEPGPAVAHLLPLALFAKGGECLFQHGGAGGVTSGEPERQPVDESVHRAGLTRCAWCLKRCACDLRHSGTEPAGDGCGP
jgi:hypothetical protein